MGFLCKMTINGTDRYMSMDGYALTHNWKPRIISIDSITYAPSTDHGGYVKISVGNITINPAEFVYDWPPPRSCAITFYYTDTDEASMTTIFTGNAHIVSYDRVSVIYALYPPAYSETIDQLTYGTLVNTRYYLLSTYNTNDDFTAVGYGGTTPGTAFKATGTTPNHWSHGSLLIPYFNDTLSSCITDLLIGNSSITSLNTTYLHNNPAVFWWAQSNSLVIDAIDALCRWGTHLFYVVGTTGYLVDMDTSNGSDMNLTELGFFAYPKYFYKPPISVLTAETMALGNYTGNYVVPQQGSVSSSYTYGSTSQETGQVFVQDTTLNTALTSILAFENAPRISIEIPMIAGNFPVPGQKIVFSDSSTVDPSNNCYVYARKITYDFMNYKIQIEGDGSTGDAINYTFGDY